MKKLTMLELILSKDSILPFLVDSLVVSTLKEVVMVVVVRDSLVGSISEMVVISTSSSTLDKLHLGCHLFVRKTNLKRLNVKDVVNLLLN